MCFRAQALTRSAFSIVCTAACKMVPTGSDFHQYRVLQNKGLVEIFTTKYSNLSTAKTNKNTLHRIALKATHSPSDLSEVTIAITCESPCHSCQFLAQPVGSIRSISVSVFFQMSILPWKIEESRGQISESVSGPVRMKSALLPPRRYPVTVKEPCWFQEMDQDA